MRSVCQCAVLAGKLTQTCLDDIVSHSLDQIGDLVLLEDGRVRLDSVLELHNISITDRLGELQVGCQCLAQSLLVEETSLRDFTEQQLDDTQQLDHLGYKSLYFS